MCTIPITTQHRYNVGFTVKCADGLLWSVVASVYQFYHRNGHDICQILVSRKVRRSNGTVVNSYPWLTMYSFNTPNGVVVAHSRNKQLRDTIDAIAAFRVLEK